MDDSDFATLPLQEQWGHSKWKARQTAYSEVLKKFEAYDAGALAEWAPHLSSAAVDSNVIALEAGLKCINAYIVAAAADQAAVDAIYSQIFRPMAEKALTAIKATVKVVFQQICIDFANSLSDPGAVVLDLVPFLDTKSQKVVAATVASITPIYATFGKYISIKPALVTLEKLLANADRNVRTETVKLACVLVQVSNKHVVEAAMAQVKPVLLKELSTKFEGLEKLDAERTPLKFQDQVEEGEDDVAEAGQGKDEDMDPFQYINPVVVTIPDICEPLQSSKWKERKEGLDAVEAALEGVQRIAPCDFSELCGELGRVIAKDATVPCYQSAINIVRMLSDGLRTDFVYADMVLVPVLERLKEKKGSVLEAIAAAVTSFSQSLGLEKVLAGLCKNMSHKVANAKIETSKLLVKLLCDAKQPPSQGLLNELAQKAAKNLSDPQEPVRAENARVLAVLVKIMGPAMNSTMGTLDDLRKKRVNDLVPDIEIKMKVAKSAPKPASKSAANPAAKVPARTVAATPAAPAAAAPTKQPARRLVPVSKITRPPGSTPRPAGSAAAGTRQSLKPASVTSPLRSPVSLSTRRTLQNTDFTPAKQPPTRRRYEAEEPHATSPLRGRVSPLRAGHAPTTSRWHANNSQTPQLQEPQLSEELDAALLEKEKATTDRDMFKNLLEKESIQRENAERQVRILKEEVDRLKRELGQVRSPNTSLDGGFNTQFSELSIKDSRLNGRPLSLAPPRRSVVEPTAAMDSMALGSEKSRQTWERALEVSSQLKKRIEEMKRLRERST